MTSRTAAPSRFVRAGGQNIAVYESAGAGPGVLLIHGNSSSAKAFSPQLDGSPGASLRLVAIDLPGHGASERASDPDRAYTLPGYARVVRDVVDEMRLGDAVIVGWSLGGHIALEASALLPQASGFFIFGTPPLAFPPAADAFLPTPAMGSTFRADLTSEEMDAYAAAFFRPGFGRIPESFLADVRATDKRVRSALGASIAPDGYADEAAIVARLDKPLAILQGAEEQLVNPAYFERLTMPTLWRGKVQIVAGAGHAPQWERPLDFNALLESFVADCRRAKVG
jgi:pimeloyl-ACP methyl ester carboxylesterase